MDTSGSPVPDALRALFEHLQEALLLESKFQPNLQLPCAQPDERIATMDNRDGLVHVLRCLKVWFELPSEVFFTAISLMDRFLTKMIVQPKHMPCISVAAFYLAAERVSHPLDLAYLVKISQVKCTDGDVRRMSELINNKLNWHPQTNPVTALNFLNIFHRMFRAAACGIALGDLFDSLVLESELIQRLEMVACNGKCANIRSCEVALVSLCAYLDEIVRRSRTQGDDNLNDEIENKNSELLRLVEFASELQKICKISDESFYATHEIVGTILSKYNAQEHITHRQNLTWRISSRTAAVYKPTARFNSQLPVIAEHAPVPSPSKISRRSRKFSRRHGKRR